MEWTERIRDTKMECASRDEMMAIQSKKLVDLVNRVYGTVPFYTSKESKILTSFHLLPKKIYVLIIHLVCWQFHRKR